MNSSNKANLRTKLQCTSNSELAAGETNADQNLLCTKLQPCFSWSPAWSRLQKLQVSYLSPFSATNISTWFARSVSEGCPPTEASKPARKKMLVTLDRTMLSYSEYMIYYLGLLKCSLRVEPLHVWLIYITYSGVGYLTFQENMAHSTKLKEVTFLLNPESHLLFRSNLVLSFCVVFLSCSDMQSGEANKAQPHLLSWKYKRKKSVELFSKLVFVCGIMLKWKRTQEPLTIK